MSKTPTPKPLKRVLFARVSPAARQWIAEKAKAKNCHENEEVERLILADKKKVLGLRDKRKAEARAS